MILLCGTFLFGQLTFALQTTRLRDLLINMNLENVFHLLLSYRGINKT